MMHPKIAFLIMPLRKGYHLAEQRSTTVQNAYQYQAYINIYGLQGTYIEVLQSSNLLF